MSNQMSLNDECSLLDDFIQPGVSAEDLAEKWVNDYKNNESEALLSLLSLIFQTCGCKPNITLAILEEGDWTCFVKIVEEMIPSSRLSNYPIIEERKRLGKRIGRNVCEFIGSILLKTQQEILYDGYFFPHLCALLHILTKSSLRAFRHTATLIVVKITSTLAEIMRTLTSQCSKLNRQLSSERNKSSNKKSTDRIEVLENNLDKLDKYVSEIDQKITFLTRMVLPKRFRDVYNAIRLICIEELEVWLINYPMAFLGTENLKYLGWALSDPVIAVRLKSLQTLKLIYSNSKLVKEMDLFTLKFKDRIVTMSLDKSIAVSTLAIKVISLIVKCNSEVITPENKEYILSLTYSHNKEVAKAAGAFLHLCIVDDLKDKSISQKSFTSLCLLHLKDFIMHSKVMDKIPLLVDAMLSQPQVKYLTDWKCYSDILLFNENYAKEHRDRESTHNTEEDTSLSDTEERILISLMANSVKQALLYECPRKTRGDKNLQLTKVSKRNTEDTTSIELFLELLPKLMKKYVPDPEIITNLLSVCLIINVNLVSKFQDIHSLFASLMEISERHVDLDVHLACAKAMAHLCRGNSSTAVFGSSSFLGPYLGQVVSSWRNSLAQYCQMCSKKKDFYLILKEDDLIFTMEKNSKSLWAISCHFCLEEWLDWEELYTLCKGTAVDDKGKHCPVTCEVMRNSLKTALAYILWELSNKNIEDDDLLKYHIDDFFLVGQLILKSTSEIDHTVRNTTFYCLSEMMCILSKPSLSSPNLWKSSMESAVNILLQNISAMVSSEGGFDEMTLKEEEDIIKNYCSLMLRGGLPSEAAIYLLKNFNKQLISQSWKFIETTLSIMQSWSMEDFAMIILGTLTSAYIDIMKNEGTDLQKSQGFSELIMLAKQLNDKYGSDIGCHRKAAVRFHLKGIHFASELKQDNADPLPQMDFAHVLIIFSALVHKSDRRKLLQYLNDHKKSMKTRLLSLSQELNESWPLFKEYESSLLSSKRLLRTDKRSKIAKKKKLNLNQELEIQG